MKDRVLERADKLRELMKGTKAGAFVIINDESANWESLYYMSGFRGTSGALIVYPDCAELILDGRYSKQGGEQSPHTILSQVNGITDDIKESLTRHGVKTVLCEAEKTYASSWKKLEAAGLCLLDGTEDIKSLRSVKDDFEIDCIRRAGEIGTDAFLDMLGVVKEGTTEKEVEAYLNYKINLLGGETGFEMIVASGERGALPHGRATDKPIKKGESVTVDFGARWMGYFCDITRNFSIGEPNQKAAQYHDTLAEAHTMAAERLRSGVSGTEIHDIAMQVIDADGLGEYFTHGLGHGFGLEIHEAPFLSSRREYTLAAGNVVTVEPGIYIDGFGGLRLEDDYLVTDDGAERLTGKLNQCFYRI
ncbi:MAG: Xaa-Pro peptidase family protein [Synergistaceae bacterium]|nr:Xaa-Pro peptidase family protein [Synergistaceae bacterium]